MTVNEHLAHLMGHLDYTQHCCGPTSMVGSAVEEQALVEARESTRNMLPTPQRQALLLLLDQIDFTAGACSPFEMVGACLPAHVLDVCNKAMKEG